jgi:hypothetical protein
MCAVPEIPACRKFPVLRLIWNVAVAGLPLAVAHRFVGPVERLAAGEDAAGEVGGAGEDGAGTGQPLS